MENVDTLKKEEELNYLIVLNEALINVLKSRGTIINPFGTPKDTPKDDDRIQ
jgi:hypothetical protein